MGAADEDGGPAPDVRVFGQLPPGCRAAGSHPGRPPGGGAACLRAPGHPVDHHMARRRYLVAYDIRDDRRLRGIAGCMEGFGTRIQYSVFVCDLSDQEKVIMRGDIEALMKASEDSVMVVDLGAAGDSSRFLFLGHRTSCAEAPAFRPGRNGVRRAPPVV